MKNFAEDEILLINVVSKRLPFPKQFKYVLKSRNHETVKNQLLKMPCKTAVIDDAGYLQTSTFMEGHSSPKKGASSFDLFNQIGDEFWDLAIFVKEKLPDDIIVYFNMHELSNDYGEVKVRTIGKLLDEKVCVEGLFTVCLRCMTDGTKHWFKTQGGANDIAKSPEEMFDAEIENDLKAVDVRIREYWNLNNNKTEEK